METFNVIVPLVVNFIALLVKFKITYYTRS